MLRRCWFKKNMLHELYRTHASAFMIKGSVLKGYSTVVAKQSNPELNPTLVDGVVPQTVGHLSNTPRRTPCTTVSLPLKHTRQPPEPCPVPYGSTWLVRCSWVPSANRGYQIHKERSRRARGPPAFHDGLNRKNQGRQVCRRDQPPSVFPLKSCAGST